MKTYDVEITATIRKTYRVQAETRDTAILEARKQFSVLNEEGVSEYYNEYSRCEEVSEKDLQEKRERNTPKP